MKYSSLLQYAAIVAGLSGVEARPLASQGQLFEAARDTGLLLSVVRAVVNESGKVPVRVDPRPLLPEPGVLDTSERSPFLGLPQSILDERITALRGLGVGTVDAVAIGQNETCPSTFRNRDSTASPSNPHLRCPSEDFFAVAIGLPREGRKRFASDKLYDKEDGAAEGYSAVRVIRSHVGPDGSNMSVYDFVLKTDGSAWKVVRIVGLFESD